MMKKLFLFLGICLMMLSGCTSEAEKDSEAVHIPQKLFCVSDAYEYPRRRYSCQQDQCRIHPEVTACDREGTQHAE